MTADDKRVFVIYGRNVEAYQQMKLFLAAIGVGEITFDEVANREASPFVTQIVLKGIRLASAVVVLFTPDEQTALFQRSTRSASGADVPVEARWQPRPNVIFEAGVALGHKTNATVLVALGEGVAGFSDIGGIHLVRIDSPTGKESLRQRLYAVLKRKPEELDVDWTAVETSGDFVTCLPRRWRFYDELSELEGFLAAKCVIKKKADKRAKATAGEGVHTLLDMVKDICASPAGEWRRWKPRKFMKQMAQQFSDKLANKAYWWLVVAGFFQFQDTKIWFDDDRHWQYSVDYVLFSPRGLALMEKLSG